MSNEKLPLISIVTPSFNQGKYIQVTLDSVLGRQDYKNIEHIIYDGGSTDSTLDILKSYKKRYPNELSYISESDKGQSNALNKGFRKAKGEIIGWINSDDYYEDDIFGFVVEFFDKHPEVDMIYGGCNCVDEHGKFVRVFEDVYGFKKCKLKNYHEFSYHTLMNVYSGLIPQQSVFWRKRVFDKVGYINESFQFTMDYEFWLRVGKYCKIFRVNKILGNFRSHAEAKTNFRNRYAFIQESLKARKLNNGQFSLPFYAYVGLIAIKTLGKQLVMKLSLFWNEHIWLKK